MTFLYLGLCTGATEEGLHELQQKVQLLTQQMQTEIQQLRKENEQLKLQDIEQAVRILHLENELGKIAHPQKRKLLSHFKLH